MKNKLFKVCILLFFMSYNTVLFSQIATNDNNGSLESAEPVVASIDNYVWIFGLIGVLYVFTKFKSIAK